MENSENKVLECPENDDIEMGSEAESQNPICYVKSKQYWENIPASVNGMLGGFGMVSTTDITGSTNFLNLMFKLKPPPNKTRALDCGAGIGRISKHLLMNFFDTVDLVEQDENFARTAEESLKSTGHLGRIFNVGLQDFKPEEKYDVIWIQWVLGYLTDDDLIEFLRICTDALNKNGLIVIKENFTKSGDVEPDETDSSVTRSLKLMKKIIKAADLRILKEAKQTHFPKSLFPVHMIACKSKVK